MTVRPSALADRQAELIAHERHPCYAGPEPCLVAGSLLVALAHPASGYDLKDKGGQDRLAIPSHPCPCVEQVSARPAAVSSPTGSQPAAADSPCMGSASRSAAPGAAPACRFTGSIRPPAWWACRGSNRHRGVEEKGTRGCRGHPADLAAGLRRARSARPLEIRAGRARARVRGNLQSAGREILALGGCADTGYPFRGYGWRT